MHYSIHTLSVPLSGGREHPGLEQQGGERDPSVHDRPQELAVFCIGEGSLCQRDVLLRHRYSLCQRPRTGGVSHKTVFLIARDGCPPMVILQNAYAPPGSLWADGAVSFAGDAGMFSGYDHADVILAPALLYHLVILCHK